MMRFSTRYTLMAATAFATLMVAATPAGAATGQLVLGGSGPDTIVANPSRGCLSTASAFDEVANNTNVSVVVYSDIGCSGLGLVVDPGRTMSVGSRHSVYIPS